MYAVIAWKKDYGAFLKEIGGSYWFSLECGDPDVRGNTEMFDRARVDELVAKGEGFISVELFNIQVNRIKDWPEALRKTGRF